MANSVVSGFSNVYNSLYSAGSFIMQGLLGGISSMASSIYKKAAEIASNVASKISSVLKIGSPSKVMFEIGDFTMQGFELGMESNFDSIVEGVQTMASEVVEAPMPTLSNLTATAQSVDMSGYGEQSSKAISNSNIVSSSETNTLLRELISAVKDGKTITIDGREIGRTSVDYINKETRRGSTPLLSY
jgi:hypothetical protein